MGGRGRFERACLGRYSLYVVSYSRYVGSFCLCVGFYKRPVDFACVMQAAAVSVCSIAGTMWEVVGAGWAVQAL